jgi:hypothetical protein
MLINVLELNFFHPGRYLPRSNKVFLDVDGQEKRSESGGWEDKRPFLLTLFDPFDIGGFIRENTRKKKENNADTGTNADDKQVANDKV